MVALSSLVVALLMFAGPIPQNPARGYVVSGGGGGTFLLNENFEGTGAPSGWSTVGSFNYDYTTTPLEGAQSARSPTIATDFTACSLGSDHSEELWGKFRFQVSALPSAGGLFQLMILPNQALASGGFVINLRDTGKLEGGLTTTAQTTSTVSANTTYYVWWHFLKGTAVNSTWDIWFDSVDTRPGSGNNHIGSTTDSFIHDVGYVEFAAAKSGTAASLIVDMVQIKTADFQ